jgi:hypothetical protein
MEADRMESGDGKGRTRFRDEGGTWYRLDNAGCIMPSVSDSVATNLFRLSATLDEDLDIGLLDEALQSVARRFPYFTVELRRGLFWHYLVPHERALRVEPDSIYPMQGYDANTRGRCLFRVRASGRCVACEFHHTIADGTGGMRFLKNLLAEYWRRRWPEEASANAPGDSAGGSADDDLYCLADHPSAQEYEDAYRRYYEDEYPPPGDLRRAFRPRSAPLPKYVYRVTCGILPLGPALAVAKDHGASLTELLAAAYIDALQELWLACPPRSRRRSQLALSIPVNMRKLYPSATNRNFSLFTFLTQDMRLGRRKFEEIVKRAHHQLRFGTDTRTMGQQLSRNVSAANIFIFRLFPLPLKILAFRILYSAFGEDLYSGAISNLGAVSLPAQIAAHVERFDFVPSPTRGKTNVGALSWKGSLYITFGSLGVSREIERLFFTRLRKLGLRVRIECNL